MIFTEDLSRNLITREASATYYAVGKNNELFNIIKETDNAPTALLSYITTREILKTRENHKPTASTSRTSRVLLKITKCLHNLTMHDEQVFSIPFIRYKGT